MSERSRQQVRFMKSSSEKGKLLQLMAKAGISETESSLYFSLLQYGPRTISDLAQLTGTPRTTVHENIQRLVNKKLVRLEDKKVTSEPIEKMKLVLLEQEVEAERRLKEIQKLNKDLQDVMQSLQDSLSAIEDDSPLRFKVYKGKEGVEEVYRDCTTADEVYSWVNIEKYHEIFPIGSQIGSFMAKALEDNPKRKFWDITVDSSFARKNAQMWERYYCRYLPEVTVPFGFDILIYNNKVSIMRLEPDDMFATVIESEPIALIFKFIFKTMWPLMLE